jgi:hypothetical protein
MKTGNGMKRALMHVGAIAFFFLLTVMYFYPALEGKVLQQGDVTNYQGMAHELELYGQPSGWTGAMFGGMPSYHITGYSTGTDFVQLVRQQVLGAFHPGTAGPIGVLMLSAYVLLLVLGIPVWGAVLGAVAMAFSSYNIIIIEAGHVTKAWTLAFVPLVLAGMMLVFRQRYWVGFVVFAAGLALTIGANHLQITYYTGLFGAILAIGFVINCLRRRAWGQAAKAGGVLTAGVALAMLASANNLYLNYESGQESMRGQSELTSGDEAAVDPKASTGLDKDYVFAWSYGRGETLSLLIPNVMGGSSGGTLGKDSHLYRALRSHGAQVARDGVQTYTYWGEKPFTSGPVYLGAIVCFLFVLGMWTIPGRFKWWLLGSTVFFILLAWGRNLAGFNDWMYYHFPFYGKFRTVETALVIPAFVFPIVAVGALKVWMGKRTLPEKQLLRALGWSAAITGGICLLLWMMPGAFFHFESTYDAQFRPQVPDWYYLALTEDRKALLRADALRSLVFIALAAGMLFVCLRWKNRQQAFLWVVAGLLALTLIDLWGVDKRYLNTDHFVSGKRYGEQQFQKSAADNFILQDPSLSYRVLNLRNPFNESRTSYYHKSIGGYHAAKLGRYQNLIDRRLTPEIQSIIDAFSTADSTADPIRIFAACPTLNMLNTKYIIYSPEQPPLINPQADGNAWFVRSYRFAASPDDEMAALDTLDPKTEAVLDQRFEDWLGGMEIVPDPDASIEMTVYCPDRVEYQTVSAHTGLAVFSEIYYQKGWKAFIDDRTVPIGRADWILRALMIPDGEHVVKFVFDPDDVRLAGNITTAFSGLLLLLVLASAAYAFGAKRWKRHPKKTTPSQQP